MFLEQKEEKIGIFWKAPLPKMEMEIEVTPFSCNFFNFYFFGVINKNFPLLLIKNLWVLAQEEKNLTYLRCFEPFNNLKPPTHVVM